MRDPFLTWVVLRHASVAVRRKDGADGTVEQYSVYANLQIQTIQCDADDCAKSFWSRACAHIQECMLEPRITAE
ncbi:hypothetical protein [Brevibacterium gallinarum]|uniref:SWIM-type domain-containing protein n=1 Tax=Brevibacterium gallinarum TaxID=2762220 RepID=A0ABR8WQ90_9MICO|nr:hypothetical protein [Brevibacterium gallinarum]MBD8019240.1 hypothetical protein [Brevibacterium gallinarum]